MSDQNGSCQGKIHLAVNRITARTNFALPPILVVVLLLLVACSATRIDRALKSADALRGAQKYDEAESAYQSILVKFPGKPQLAQVYLSLGDLYFYNLKKNPEAIDQYMVIIQSWPLSPESAFAHQHLAELYAQEERFDRVVEMNENLIKYFPNHPDRAKFMHEIGSAYLKMKNYPQARLELQKILAEKDVPPEIAAAAWYEMGETYFLEGNESQAISYYKRMIELYPKSSLVPTAKLQLAQCYEDLGDMQNAVAIEKSLRQQYPDDESIRAKLQQMEKRRRAKDRGPQMLPWDRKALMKGGQ